MFVYYFITVLRRKDGEVTFQDIW